MIWQDYVFVVGNLVFIAALIPSIVGKDKPAIATSILTSITLYTFAFSFATLSLWGSAVLTFIVASLWLTLAFQKYKITKKK